MGLADLKDYGNLGVSPHPHIGLFIHAFLFEGAIMHCDRVGY